MELTFDFPSQCADNLATGKADLGLISSIEYQRISNLAVAPGICIASKKEVKTVIIITKKDLAEVKVLAVDRFSRSSTALLQVLLKRRYNITPQFVSMTPSAGDMLREADAALIIGDAAFRVPDDQPYQKLDLASEWHRDTGLPFVFAFWAIRDKAPTERISEILMEAKNYGVREWRNRMEAIQKRWPLPEAEIQRYFTYHIHYDLGSAEVESLKLFYTYAVETKVLAAAKPIIWGAPFQG